MPRLFTGLELPKEQGLYISQFCGGLYGARWIDVENYHITLRFIGDIDRRLARDIEIELGTILREPLEVHITGLGVFGGDKPHAIIANIAANRALVELQSEHERIMRKSGLPKEPRKFTPHITLARLRGTTTMDVAGYFSSHQAFLGQSFIAKSFALFSAKPSTGGGPYLIEASYTLGEDAEEMDERNWIASYAPAKKKAQSYE